MGTIPGFYTDASSVNHGFVRDKHGGLTTFDAPGAGTLIGQGTFAGTPNPAGAIVISTKMRSMYFTARSWKASKPCEKVWKQLRGHVKERREKNFVQLCWILERA